MRAMLHTAGERVELTCAVPWIAGVLTEGAAGQLTAGDGSPPDVRVTVERDSAPFDVTGWRVLTRDAWCRPGQVVVKDACSSGLDLRVTAGEPALEVVARWRPSGKGRAAAAVLRSRARLLLRAVLLQYPALWQSQQRGRAPLHASVCGLAGADGQAVLLAGPGGVGKSTLVHGELLSGAISTCDNLCVSDGRHAWGVVEPLRLPAEAHDGKGRRMPHGRREAAWPRRADQMTPGRLVVLVRGGEPGGGPVRTGAGGALSRRRHLHGRGTAPLLGVRVHPGARHRPGRQSSAGAGDRGHAQHHAAVPAGDPGRPPGDTAA